MEKLCIFCGGKPDKKTKEHVIPRWLIQLTGNPKRKAFLGYIKNLDTGFDEREYAFDQFTFPACDSCNNQYAELETEAKNIINKLLHDESILAEDISTFLDWLDKVRIGMWLGMRQLDNNFAGISPSFHIGTRISQYDRVLITEKSDGTEKRLNLGGVDTLSFAFTPSAFVLIINNYYFTNISYMFLFSRRIGFPYPKNLYQMPGDKVEATFAKGKNRVMRPLLRKAIREKGSYIYQAMYRGGLINTDISEYNSEYVKKHSMDHANGVGNIFLDNGHGLQEYTSGESLNITPAHIHNAKEQFIRSAINICEWQNWLTTLFPNTSNLAKEDKNIIISSVKTGVQINESHIKHYKTLL